jgi:RAQPRD family integrative conjugative element protein
MMKIVLIILMSLFSVSAIASDTQQKVYLVQIINQLDSIKPLIIAAAKEQDKSSRVQFHYVAYLDYTGKVHNGLLEDINEIKSGIQDKLNQTGSEPHHFQAIKGDYLNLTNIKSRSAENGEVAYDVK